MKKNILQILTLCLCIALLVTVIVKGRQLVGTGVPGRNRVQRVFHPHRRSR